MLGLDITQLTTTKNPYIEKAVRLFQLGQYQFALDDLERATVNQEDRLIYDLLKGEISRRIQAAYETSDLILVWRIDRNCWERDWLRYLLKGVIGVEVDGEPSDALCKRMIVVDNLIDNQKADWYRNHYNNGSQICLIHLSDEHLRDEVSAVYRWCALVYRNFLSSIYQECGSIKAFPLGTKIGFALDAIPVTASARAFTWGFAGDVEKSTRREMFEHMSRVENGSLHFTSGFGASDALGVEQYQAFLSSCVFGPCPSGYVNLDSFRVYECLECGTIPIVEMRASFDYFTDLLGPHPMPTIHSWRDAPELVDKMVREGDVDVIQAKCVAWWQAVKTRLKSKMRDDIFQHLNIAPLAASS